MDRNTYRRWVPGGGARHPALLTAALLATGIFLGDASGIPWFLPLGAACLAALIALLAAIFVRTRTIALVSIATALVALGAARITLEQHDRPASGLIELSESPRPVEVYGRLVGVPYQKSSGWRAAFEIQAVRGATGLIPLGARVLIVSDQSFDGVRYGDYLRTTARIRRPPTRRNPGGFDYAAHLARLGIDGLAYPIGGFEPWSPRSGALFPHNVIGHVRDAIRARLAAYLPDTARALVLGLLLGDTDRLPAGIFKAFRESGTLHLLAVSGANVWLVVGVFLWPLRVLRLPRWTETVVLLVVIVAFSFLTRNEPSVVRAALVAGLVLLGRLLYRPVGIMNAVGVSAAVVLMVSPDHLFRPGFQLSFAAVIGIGMVLASDLGRLRSVRLRPLRYLTLVGASSLAATVATVPIVAWHFGSVPVYGVFANLLLVPIAGLVTQLAIWLLFVSSISSASASVIAFAIDQVLGIGVWTASFCAGLPGAVLPWSSPTVAGTLVWYGAVVLLLNLRYRYLWWRPVVYVLAAGSLVFAMVTSIRDDRAKLSLALLDTGQQRVTALRADRHTATWIVDEPGLDEELRDWVLSPLAAELWDQGPPLTSQSWSQCDSASAGSAQMVGVGITWRQLVTCSSTKDSLSRIWLDYLMTAGDTVLWVRDWPTEFDHISWQKITAGRPHVLVIPSDTPVSRTSSLIKRLRPRHLVFHGFSRFQGQADQTLALWRLRFPDVRFWSTAANGGIVIDFPRSGGLTVRPTIPD